MEELIPAVIGVSPGEQWTGMTALIDGVVVDTSTVARELATEGLAGAHADRAFDLACLARFRDILTRHHEAATDAWRRIGVTTHKIPWRIAVALMPVPEGRRLAWTQAATWGQVRVFATHYPGAHLVEPDPVRAVLAGATWARRVNWNQDGWMGHDAHELGRVADARRVKWAYAAAVVASRDS